jgi:Flp pilus assembly pilin Flp
MFFLTPGPLNYAEADVRLRIAKSLGLNQAGERGASAVEWVIISAILIVIVTVVGGILLSKLTEKAKTLDLTTPAP